jgi:acyl-Coa thioesterase superfamily protein/acyl-CoA thioesterase superfamily protein
VTEAVFVRAGERFRASELARGPWDPDAQHGGAPAALLMRELERLHPSEDLHIARVTYEFLRPVPIGELEVQSEVVRPGRRVRLLEASIAAAGVEVVRARSLQVKIAELDAGGEDAEVPPDVPELGRESAFRAPYRPMFYPDAVEIRFVSGSFGGGHCTAWFRLRAPIVAGEEPSPLQRVAAAADFGNGISAPLSWDDYLFINPDLTLYIEREPAGEWICLRSRTRVVAGATAVAESELFDQRGRIGRAVQALLVARR